MGQSTWGVEKMSEATKMALSKATELRAIINEALKNEDKATLALKAVAITLAASKLNEIIYHHDKYFTDRVQAWFYQFVRSLPGIGEKIQVQVDEARGCRNFSCRNLGCQNFSSFLRNVLTL